MCHKFNILYLNNDFMHGWCGHDSDYMMNLCINMVNYLMDMNMTLNMVTTVCAI